LTVSSKRHRENAALVDSAKEYELEEAVGILKSARSAKFDESVEVSVRLGIDAKKSDQSVRGAIVLPHGTGKASRVVVFAEGPAADEAKEAGADEIGSEALAKKIEGGWLDFDVAIAHPACMKFVGKLGKLLGPRGLMPSPKAGTVTDKVGAAVKEYKAGKVEFRNDEAGNVRVAVGKLSFDAKKVVENIGAFLEHLQGLRPGGAKGTFVRRVTVSSTMGPGVKVRHG
jgi:large subunit ribosomal protein L1